jgi:16S rRNA (cytidine1402-2'-O)-methyltransferase
LQGVFEGIFAPLLIFSEFRPMPKGKLFLIPSVLAENTAHWVISPQVQEVIAHTKIFLVENPRSARRYISSLKLGVTIEELHMEVLDKDTKPEQLPRLMLPLINGADIGVISEAGCPGIADPGALAVAYAHQKGIQVVPISGPSSMFFGTNGFRLQRAVFCFSRLFAH